MLTELQCRLLHGTALVHNAGSVQAARLPRPMRHGRYARMNQAHDPTCVYIHVQTIRQVRKGLWHRTSSPASGRPLGVGGALGVPGAPSAGAASSGSAVKRRSSQLKGSHTRLQAGRAPPPSLTRTSITLCKEQPSSVPATGRGTPCADQLALSSLQSSQGTAALLQFKPGTALT